MNDIQSPERQTSVYAKVLVTAAFAAFSLVVLLVLFVCAFGFALREKFPAVNSGWSILLAPLGIAVFFGWVKAFDVWLDFVRPSRGEPVEPIGETVVALRAGEMQVPSIRKRGFLSWSEGEAQAFFTRWAIVALVVIFLFGSHIIAWFRG